jgi:hypothetical protein
MKINLPNGHPAKTEESALDLLPKKPYDLPNNGRSHQHAQTEVRHNEANYNQCAGNAS